MLSSSLTRQSIVTENIPVAAKGFSNLKELVAILSQQSPEESKVFCQTYKKEISHFINPVNCFCSVLRDLNDDQRAIVLEAFASSSIESVADLRQLSRDLNSEQRAIVFKVCQSEAHLWSCIVRSVEHLRDLLQLLTVDQCAIILEGFQPKLPELVESVKDFVRLWRGIDKDKRAIAFAACQSQAGLWLSIIRSAQGLERVLRYLTEDQQVKLIDSCKENLLQLEQVYKTLRAREGGLLSFFGLGRFDFNRPHETSRQLLMRFFSQIESDPRGLLARAYTQTQISPLPQAYFPVLSRRVNVARVQRGVKCSKCSPGAAE